jgi:predicted methyltransferase
MQKLTRCLQLLCLCLPALAACGGSSPAPAATAPAGSVGGEARADGLVFGSLQSALAGAHRSAQSRAHDAVWHPRETLEFFGVRPGQRVLELWPDSGWYTELLAPLLHEEGALVAVVAEGQPLEPYLALLQSRPDIYEKVELVTLSLPSQLSLGPAASADVVLSFDDFHIWSQGGYLDALHAEIFRSLKPGGSYAVVERRATPGTPADKAAINGYVAEETVIATAAKAGLVLEARSQINANPDDPKQRPTDDSDRMTLLFRRPAFE